MTTHSAKQENFPRDKREWYHVDASGKILGRMAVRIADVLRGKNRPDFTPHVDMGPYVVVTNAEKIRVTGKKMDSKLYKRYSGYPGGLRMIPLGDMLRKRPADVVRLAVRRMLPKNKLAANTLSRLKVYSGPEHPHTYHKPKELPL